MALSSESERLIRIPADMEKVRRILVVAARRACPPRIADEVEDIVQLALMKLMKSSNGGEGNRTVSASYIWRVAYTSVIDEIRRRDRRREDPLIEHSSGANPIAPQPNPEREAVSRHIGDAIRDCLQRMVDARRRVVTLHLVGHTVPEISGLLDLRPKQADNLVYRGMADLRRCLSGKGITP